METCDDEIWIDRAGLGDAPHGRNGLRPSRREGVDAVGTTRPDLRSLALLTMSCRWKGRSSPLKVAPPFRTLHERYPVESLEEALGEGIVTGHPTMPEFQLDPGQVRDVVTYLKSLED